MENQNVEVYCWTVRWQEKGRQPMFRHFYPRAGGKNDGFGYTEEEAKAFMAGVQCNTSLQHSEFQTIVKNSPQHRILLTAAGDTSTLISLSLQKRMKARSVGVK